MSRQGAELLCDSCGGTIGQGSGRHAWIGPVPAGGEEPRYYHLDRDYPECRVAGGAGLMPGELSSFIALRLAQEFTPGEGTALERIDLHMGPVTGLEAAKVIADALRAVGVQP